MVDSKNRIFLMFYLLIAEIYSFNSTEDCPKEKQNCTKNVSYGNSLIFTTPTKIKVLNLTTNERRVIRTLVECSALAAANDFVYYTKYRDASKRLYKTSIISKETFDVLNWHASITSLAIDYITNNIYFSTDTSILVCNGEDRKSCNHVVCFDARYLALAPRSGIQSTGENSTNFKNHVCSYYNSQFLCKDKRKCIDLIDTCNGECNCLDCSDESDQCWKHDEYFCQTCYHLCLPTPDGPQCLCDIDNYKSTRICREIEECGQDTACNQRCVKYEGVERCTCDENYSAKPHTIGRSCKSEFPQGNLLLFSTKNKLKVFHFHTGKTSLVQNNVDCKGLSAAGDYCYHGAIEKDTGYVLRTSIVNGQTDLGFETHSPIIFSIDVDWITGNVYFSTDQSLSVCSEYGYFCAQIKSLINLTDSCHIALAPRSGLLFHSLRSLYIKHEHSRIMKSSMDGSDEMVLASVGLLHPISLTVDESSQKVYWLDKDYSEIESIQFNGKNRKVWFSDSRMNFFAISELENDFFWTRENINSIGLNAEIYSKFITDEDATSIKYLYAYNPLLQATKIPNPCRKASCNGLCLLRQSPTKRLDFTCLCTDFTPSNGNLWCNKQSAQYDWQFETDSEYEIQPPSMHSEGKSKWLNSMNSVVVYGFLIILASASVCLIFRHRIVYYFEGVFNQRHVDRNEYIEL